jgi:hypothetical protein
LQLAQAYAGVPGWVAIRRSSSFVSVRRANTERRVATRPRVAERILERLIWRTLELIQVDEIGARRERVARTWIPDRELQHPPRCGDQRSQVMKAARRHAIARMTGPVRPEYQPGCRRLPDRYRRTLDNGGLRRFLDETARERWGGGEPQV